jgi:hypothetical protein
VSDRELTTAALKQAVAMWKSVEKHRNAYFCGDAAYEHWLKWLRGVEAGTVREPQKGMQGNGWCFDVLVHSRRIAGPWLRRKAEGFGGEAKRQLLAAAHHYAAIAEACMQGLKCPWELAVGPDKLSQWTSVMRQDQIRRLEAAREHDRAAIAAIESALSALAVAPSPQ